MALLEKSSFPDQALNLGPGSESLNPWTTPVILFFFFLFHISNNRILDKSHWLWYKARETFLKETQDADCGSGKLTVNSVHE